MVGFLSGYFGLFSETWHATEVEFSDVKNWHFDVKRFLSEVLRLLKVTCEMVRNSAENFNSKVYCLKCNLEGNLRLPMEVDNSYRVGVWSQRVAELFCRRRDSNEEVELTDVDEETRVEKIVLIVASLSDLWKVCRVTWNDMARNIKDHKKIKLFESEAKRSLLSVSFRGWKILGRRLLIYRLLRFRDLNGETWRKWLNWSWNFGFTSVWNIVFG